jgi:hypothetical protein
VISTRAGFIGGGEAVELRFDARVLSYEQLLRVAAHLRCADRVHPLTPRQRSTAQAVLGTDRIGPSIRFRADENTKYYLSRTEYRFLPMTEAQKVRVNIAVYRGSEPEQLLSPRQRQALLFIQHNPNYPWRNLINSADIRGDWERLWTIIDQQRAIEN